MWDFWINRINRIYQIKIISYFIKLFLKDSVVIKLMLSL